VTTEPMDDVTRRRTGRGSMLPGLGLGLLFGVVVIYIFGQETRFAVYGLAAILGLAPFRAAGALDGAETATSVGGPGLEAALGAGITF